MHMKPQHKKGRSGPELRQVALPTQVGELDAMRVLHANEKTIRLQSQHQLIESQLNQLATQRPLVAAEFNAAKAEAEKIWAEVAAKYKLGPKDQFDNATRRIVRAEAEPVPFPPPEPAPEARAS